MLRRLHPFAAAAACALILSGIQEGTAVAASGGAIELSTAEYTVAQGAGSVVVTISRSGGSSGDVHAYYGTHPGTALDNVDYTNTRGSVNWSNGDGSVRTIAIPISNAKPFSGTKELSFTVSSPTGATLGAPAQATVTINGDLNGAPSSGGPSAPTGLHLTGETASSISLSWSAASLGANPISHYRLYRNGAPYVTSTGTSYTDYGATDATNPAFAAAATVYTYAVSAVDTQGNEGPQTTQAEFDVYQNGTFNWPGDYSYSAWANYQDTSGGPESGPYDIAVSITGSYGGFQPYSGNVVPQWDLEAGSFGYISMDLKPTNSGQTWRLSIISRLPPGDVYPWAGVDVTSYGPTPVVGKWATYKIPLSALSIGKTSFQGSINGNTLTVTNVNSGVGVDAGGFITGNGVQPGTYITGHNANGGPGTYTISPSQYVSSTTMTEQRTAIYKFDVADQTGLSYNVFYLDNVKFTSH